MSISYIVQYTYHFMTFCS